MALAQRATTCTSSRGKSDESNPCYGGAWPWPRWRRRRTRRTSPPANNRSRNACPAIPSAKGAKNKVGPELNGLDGRHSGTAPAYNYSDANKNSGIAWDEATFKEYIKDPRAKIPGTKMIFPGIKNETEIGNLWAYLKQFGPDGKKK